MIMNVKPVLLITYKRNENLKIIINEILKSGVKKLYIYNNSYNKKNGKLEKQKVLAVRKYLKNFHYDGKKFFFFQKKHYRVDYSIKSAIDWFFKKNECGIILEDDIVPNQSFFIFCTNLLNKFKNNNKILHISGFNHLEKINSRFSYHFSQITHVWGWATWRRAWYKYDFDMNNYKSNQIFFKDNLQNRFRNYLYENTKKKKIITWDYQWDFSVRFNKGYSIRPNLNLIKNVGFNKTGTNTKYAHKKIKNINFFDMKKIIHPKKIKFNYYIDKEIFTIYEKKNLLVKKIYDKFFK